MQKSSFLIVTLLVASSLMIFNFQNNQQSPIQQIQIQFKNWKQQIGKIYQDVVEQKYRYQVFLKNYQMIKKHNQRYSNNLESFEMGLNKFSDISDQQYKEMFLTKNNYVNAFQCNGPSAPYKTTFIANFTWNDTGMIVKQVGQQGQCNSGYAFATIGAIQSAMYKTVKKIIPMSPQQLIDCSKSQGNNGCQSGSALNALQYMIAHGAMSLSDYSYKGKAGDCLYNSTKKIWDVDNCTHIQSQNLTALKSAILQQPVIISIDASDSAFKSYKSKIFKPSSSDCGKNLNHNLLAIGWGQIQTFYKTKTQYLIAKNSFGQTWGVNGYINILIDSSKDGVCGTLQQSYFPYL